MREYSVEVSPSALADLAGIHSYIAQELAEPETASFVSSYIWNRIDSLKYFPLAASKLQLTEDLGVELRYVSARKYRIIYYVDNQKVIVVRIFHSHRDIAHLLRSF